MNFQTVGCRGCGKPVRAFITKTWNPALTFCNHACRNKFRTKERERRFRPKSKRNRKINSRKAALIEKFGESFYTSDEWIHVRYEAIKQSRGYCEACGMGKRDGAKLHVDHIKPRSKFPELELEVTNLQVLCQLCNKGKSNTDMTDWRKEGVV